jgi:hypothetical protein
VKRVALLLLSVIYLLSSSGVAAESHYCCGILQSTSLSASSTATCKMNLPMKRCCKTKKQYFKVKDQHIGSSSLSFSAKGTPAINMPFLIFFDKTTVSVGDGLSFKSNTPPHREHATQYYILNCTYRI